MPCWVLASESSCNSLMTTRLESRAWSCSELIRGAAQIVDEMPATSLDTMVVEEQYQLMRQTMDMSAEEIEKMLQDQSNNKFMSC